MIAAWIAWLMLVLPVVMDIVSAIGAFINLLILAVTTANMIYKMVVKLLDGKGE